MKEIILSINILFNFLCEKKKKNRNAVSKLECVTPLDAAWFEPQCSWHLYHTSY